MLNIILQFIGLIVFSWVLVHFLAFLGVFLAAAYPLWWLLSFRRMPCFICKIKKTERCSFSHSLFDSFFILVFTFIAVGLVILESKVLFQMGFPPTPKTVSFVIPSKGQYRLGEIFPMKIEISGIKVPINAIQADISFESSKLEVVDISTDESFANIFVNKEIDNETGYARLTGGLPNPGYFSDRGTFGTVFFRGKTPGVVRVEFLPTSMVLANDGRGTNVLNELTAVSYLILPERLSVEEEEMQKSIFLGSSVLGESSDNTQLKFYAEDNILGAKTLEERVANKFSLLGLFIAGLEKIDQFILDQWGKVFNFLFRR